jgi:hypothetical protein
MSAESNEKAREILEALLKSEGYSDETVGRALDFVFEEIPKIRFFTPDDEAPEENWIVFNEDTWSDARFSALDSAWKVAWESIKPKGWEDIWEQMWRATRRGDLEFDLYAPPSTLYTSAEEAAESAANAAGLKNGASIAFSAALYAMYNAKAVVDSREVPISYLWTPSDNKIVAENAVDDAVGDAALMLQYILVSDLPDFEGKSEYLEFAKENMKVWQRGYASLWYDAEGKKYVYAETRDTPTPLRTEESDEE